MCSGRNAIKDDAVAADELKVAAHGDAQDDGPSVVSSRTTLMDSLLRPLVRSSAQSLAGAVVVLDAPSADYNVDVWLHTEVCGRVLRLLVLLVSAALGPDVGYSLRPSPHLPRRSLALPADLAMRSCWCCGRACATVQGRRSAAGWLALHVRTDAVRLSHPGCLVRGRCVSACGQWQQLVQL